MNNLWIACAVAVGISIGQAAPPGNTRVEFRLPQPAAFTLETPPQPGAKWIQARVAGTSNVVEIGSKVIVETANTSALHAALRGKPLRLVRQVSRNLSIFEAPDALTAAQQAAELARDNRLLAAYPLLRREAELDGPYAPEPDDYWFNFQWYLESRSAEGTRAGADLNVRGAWPFTRGAGVTIAIADTGFELDHPDLAARTGGSPHFNFETRNTNGAPPVNSAIHGTSVAGFAAATASNGIGIAGVAPEARLASWVVIGTNQALSGRQFLVDDEALMDMFQFQSNLVQVQNHSWGVASARLQPMGPLVNAGIGNAIEHGRNGRGSIIVRSAGNGRQNGFNANDSELRSDPRCITVAAVRGSGRVTGYSNPGSCILVAAGGGEGSDYMLTTDRQDSLGYNTFVFQGQNPTRSYPDSTFLNYIWNFQGTSASAPQIAGLAALMLSINPALTYRDVQQILIHAARHVDTTDPHLRTNGAGLVVSPNTGFGVPDAAEALRLAADWSPRPPLTTMMLTNETAVAIPDAGLRVLVAGTGLAPALQSIKAAPSLGPHPDAPTPQLPLVDAGTAASPVNLDLTNKGALIEYTGSFADPIHNVARAGAAFAVLFHDSDTNLPSAMLGTDLVPIPAVLIAQSSGLALRSFLASNNATAQLALLSAQADFTVVSGFSCEQVGVRVALDHPTRADLRITVRSPHGTFSMLQQVNGDTLPAPTDWTYWSTHHFYEAGAGTWNVFVTDEFPGATGSVQSVQLILRGVAISDSDADGLDDAWETNHFGSLSPGPTDDPDRDGYNNAREQILQTSPNTAPSLRLDLSGWNASRRRLSWNASPAFTYRIFAGTDAATLTLTTNFAGRFPEGEWFPVASGSGQFFRIEADPLP